MVKLTVVFGGSKHELELSPADTVGDMKARLEPLVSLPPPSQKLILKGKQPPDTAVVGDLGLADGARVMLMRGQAAAATATPASASKRPLPPSAMPADTVPQPSPPPASSVGSGTVALMVAQGKQQHTVMCEATSTVRELKELLRTPTLAEVAHQRLLLKGREPADTDTVGGLGLGSGGKLMLLFREGHHRQVEGSAVVADASSRLIALEDRWAALQRKLSKRLLDGPAGLSELGALDADAAALAQDLRNVAPTAGAAAEDRVSQLATLERLADSLGQARQELAAAELNAQLQR